MTLPALTRTTLSGKHAIISGGSRGIGLAIARRLASEGASCTLVGRDRTALEAAVQSLSPPAPPCGTDDPQQHGTCAFDVAHVAPWQHLADSLKSRTVDVLVNAAGISQNSLLVRTRADDVENLVDTNLLGTIWGCCIINLSSLLATNGGQGASVYAATKGGIVSLTRSLAWELGRFNIRVNVILPGYIATDMTKGNDNADVHRLHLEMAVPQLSAKIPLGRLGSAEEVADAAAFLAMNQYCHNTVLNIDGGLSAT